MQYILRSRFRKKCAIPSGEGEKKMRLPKIFHHRIQKLLLFVCPLCCRNLTVFCRASFRLVGPQVQLQCCKFSMLALVCHSRARERRWYPYLNVCSFLNAVFAFVFSAMERDWWMVYWLDLPLADSASAAILPAHTHRLAGSPNALSQQH